MTPPEVAAALKVLAERPRFGDKEQLYALEVMQKWQETNCRYCQLGITSSTAGKYPCQVCEGTGKVWIRR